MTDQSDWIDSHAPIDCEVVTDAPTPLPEPRKFAPVEAKPKSWRENLRALVERIGL